MSRVVQASEAERKPRWPTKDPDDVLDYTVDWSGRLTDDEQIASSDWLYDVDGLTEDSATNTTSSTTVWLSAGALDDDYEVTNRVTTTGGRTMDQTVKLRVRGK